MTFAELLTFIGTEHARLADRYPAYQDPGYRLLSNGVKLAEETGELCNELMAASRLQRAEKADGHDLDSAANEVADVLIVTLLIAKELGVDVEKALAGKIEKINERYKK